MRIEITESLHDFLKNNNALDQFCENTFGHYSIEKRNQVFVKLDSAFIWMNSSEGYGFWHDLNADFEDDWNNDTIIINKQ